MADYLQSVDKRFERSVAGHEIQDSGGFRPSYDGVEFWIAFWNNVFLASV
jgi:hypothetical protein